MKRIMRLIAILIVLLMLITACGKNKESYNTDTNPVENEAQGDKKESESGNNNQEEKYPQIIILCGETHSDLISLDNELKKWEELYAKGARHLFIEDSYAGAAFLNRWMHEDTDEILDQLWIDAEGTQGNSTICYNFLKVIKDKFPDTVFHGTDVGHQYYSIGERYLDVLKSEGMEDSEEYRLADGNYEQGKTYYEMLAEYAPSAEAYREKWMTLNFMRECAKLPGEIIMGIYGYPHVEFGTGWYGSGTSMGTRLHEKYGDILTTLDVRRKHYINEDTIVINGKEYEAYYYGEVEVSSTYPECVSRKFWQLKNAYNDFVSCEATGAVEPYNYYGCEVLPKQIYIIECKMKDGSVVRRYMRSDGTIQGGEVVTSEFVLGDTQ